MADAIEAAEPSKKKLSRYWSLLGLIPILVAVGIRWLNTGTEVCPGDAHALMQFSEQHHLHYRVVLQKKLDESEPFWCADLWPKGEHWYSDDSYYAAGTPYHPRWNSCGANLANVVIAITSDYDKSPHGDYSYVPSKTLIQCER